MKAYLHRLRMRGNPKLHRFIFELNDHWFIRIRREHLKLRQHQKSDQLETFEEKTLTLSS